MSTKAQLEVVVTKLTEEKELLLRQIKNLKKSRTCKPTPADPTKTAAYRDMEDAVTFKAQVISRLNTQVEVKENLIATYKQKAIDFVELPWYERLFLNKEELYKKLL